MNQFSWERPIEKEILQTMINMLFSWRQQENRNVWDSEAKGVIKGNIMAYKTMIKNIEDQIKIREQVKAIKKNYSENEAWDMGTVYKKLEAEK